MPAPVLFAPETFNLAEVTRGIEVARRLATRRPVLFCGLSRRYANRIVQAGFEFRLLSPELSEHEADQLLALDQGKALRNPLTASVMSRRVAAERHLIHRSGAAGVVIGSTVSQFISARAEARPLVYLKPFAYSSAHIATMRSTGLWPATGRWARSWDRAGAAAARAVLPRLRLLPPGWRRLAAQNGVRLPPSSTAFLEADLNLITTPAPFLPQPMQLPVSYAVVGPISARLDAAIPEEVRAAADRAAPVVYVAVGSSGGREVVLPILHGMADRQSTRLNSTTLFRSGSRPEPDHHPSPLPAAADATPGELRRRGPDLCSPGCGDPRGGAGGRRSCGAGGVRGRGQLGRAWSGATDPAWDGRSAGLGDRTGGPSAHRRRPCGTAAERARDRLAPGAPAGVPGRYRHHPRWGGDRAELSGTGLADDPRAPAMGATIHRRAEHKAGTGT